MSFGQSFQITPIQLATTVSSIIKWKPCDAAFWRGDENAEGEVTHTFVYGQKEHIVSEETSATMRYLLEK